MSPSSTPSASVVRAAEAEWLPFGATSRFRFISEGGAGAPDVYEERSGYGTSAPLHRHPWHSWELVIEGDVAMVVDDVEHRLGPGDAIHIPAGAVHSYVVESAEARVIGVCTSEGRFPTLQREAGPLFAGPGGPDMEKVAVLAAQADLELMGPPLAPSERAPS